MRLALPLLSSSPAPIMIFSRDVELCDPVCMPTLPESKPLPPDYEPHTHQPWQRFVGLIIILVALLLSVVIFFALRHMNKREARRKESESVEEGNESGVSEETLARKSTSTQERIGQPRAITLDLGSSKHKEDIEMRQHPEQEKTPSAPL